MNLDQPNYFTPPSTPAEPTQTGDWRVRDGDAEDDEDEGSAAVEYEQLRIVRPANDQAIRDNAGNVAVVASVEPALQAGHVMQVYLDGALRQSGTTTTFPLVNVDRGTHSVAIRIVDESSGETLAASEPVVFHLQRRSVLLQPGNRGGK